MKQIKPTKKQIAGVKQIGGGIPGAFKAPAPKEPSGYLKGKSKRVVPRIGQVISLNDQYKGS